MFIKNVPQIATYTTPGILKPDNETIEVDENGVLSTTVSPTPHIEVVLLTTGTDDQIMAMIDGYYTGKLNLEDIKSILGIGDTRTANNTDKSKFKIAAHNSFSGDYTTSIVEQSTCKLVILDFDHDILTTSIGNITKALVTIQMYGMLGTSASAIAYGRMNNSSSAIGGWASMKRRTQCNGNLYNALGFKSKVKQVVKQYCANYQSSTISTTNDYCFLCSEYEILGNKSYAPGIEGTQYKYFQITSNRTKYQGLEGKGSSYQLLTRSLYSSDADIFLMGPDSNASGPNGNYGVVPTCAL